LNVTNSDLSPLNHAVLYEFRPHPLTFNMPSKNTNGGKKAVHFGAGNIGEQTVPLFLVFATLEQDV